MSGEINVLARTQIIVVEPLSKSVSIINAGPIGPPGPPGPPGADSTVPGPPGPSYTDEQAQDAVGGILVDSSTVDFTYDDAGNSITAIVKDNSITSAKLADMVNNRIKGRIAGSTGDPEDLTPAQVRDIVLNGLLTTNGDMFVLDNTGHLVRLPNPLDTQILVGDTTVAGGMSWKYKSVQDSVWKVLGTSRASTTTFTDDPDLVTPSIPANKKVRFKIFLWWSTPTAADFKYNVTGPAGASLAVVKIGGGPGANPAFGGPSTAFPISATHTETSGTDFGTAMLEGVMQNGATPGPIKVQWAQNTSNASNTTLIQGSWMDYLILPL